MAGAATTVQIRHATAADVATLVALNREVQALHAALAPEVFKVDPADRDIADFFAARLASASNHSLLAEANGAVAGYVWFDVQYKPATPFSHEMARAFVHHIVVRAEQRRRGIATALLDAVAAHGREAGVSQLALETWATNDAARRFFEARGFEPARVAMTRRLG